MLAAKGYRATVRLEKTGRWMRLPGALLHDESGSDWPGLSVLFAAYSKRGGDEDAASDDIAAYKWFGYDPRAGTLHRPPRSMDDWDYIGEASEIRYSRPGANPGRPIGFLFPRPAMNFKGKYEHEFGNGLWIFKTGLPMLFKLSDRPVYRLELPPWGKFNWRGIVLP